MNVNKLFEEAEKKTNCRLMKGPFMKALCEELRKLIPDDPVMLDLKDAGVMEATWYDIGYILLTFMKDIQDTTPFVDPLPIDMDNEEDEWETYMENYLRNTAP